jgi:hypothetical protein
MRTIKKKDGTPFSNKNMAKATATRKDLEEYNLIEVEGGWAIEVPGEDPKEEVIVKEIMGESKVYTGKWEGWTPASLLNIPEEYKDPRFTYRWCDTGKDGNITKKISEGWEVDREISKKRGSSFSANSQTEREFKDNTQPEGSVTKLRELILMRMPRSLAEQRNKFYRDKATQKVTQTKHQLNSGLQGGVYGNVEIN